MLTLIIETVKLNALRRPADWAHGRDEPDRTFDFASGKRADDDAGYSAGTDPDAGDELGRSFTFWLSRLKMITEEARRVEFSFNACRLLRTQPTPQFRILRGSAAAVAGRNLGQYAKFRAGGLQEAQPLVESSISATQSRGARGMLGWNQKQLAEAAQVSRMTVVDFEGGRRAPHSNNLAAIRTALEAAGVIFIDENGGGAGVRLRKGGK